ncbi:MAG: RNA 3'-terminal phosphate cyclase [Phycisphaerales bacterium]|nr:RNA 3'-terminal phosphate cyclase [Phycisphaerales bacterium]
MINIDGSFGEGGGQIVRSALALSMVTGQPFTIEKIRARRSKPGLMRQHLTAVQAAAEVCGAEVSGDAIGSTALTFTPGTVRGGEYAFSIGTAGSTTLVLQTVLLPLVLAPEPSHVVLEGGTHNPFAPPFEFLARAYLPLLRRMGADVRAQLLQPGFYPAGGGRIEVDIAPVAGLAAIDLLERGAAVARTAQACVANLARSIAEREIRVIRRQLAWPAEHGEIEEITGAHGPGNVVTITVEHEHVTEVFTGFGERQRAAEAVADAAARECRAYLKATAPVGEHLTDQLMLPLALAGGGSFRSTGLTPHAHTHIELIRKFLDVPIETQREATGEVVVRFG